MSASSVSVPEIEIVPVFSFEASLAGSLDCVDEYFSAAYDGKDSILLLGGLNEGNKILSYDINTEAVTEVGFLATRRLLGALGTDQDKNFYYFGGNSWTHENTVSYYNVIKFNSTDSRTVEVASLEGQAVRCITAASNEEDGVIYTFAAFERKSPNMKIFKFTPNSNGYEAIGEVPGNRFQPSVVWLRGSAYMIGGYCHLTEKMLDTVIKFDPSTRTVTELGVKLPKCLCSASAMTDGHKIYVIGGKAGDTEMSLHQITELDVDQNTAKELLVKNLPTRLAGTTAVYVPKLNVIYTFGGVLMDGRLIKDVYKINLN